MSQDDPAGPEAGELSVPRAGIEYLPHQVTGVRWMMAREAEGAPVCRGGILADDMGLGKTFQTIGLLRNGLALRTLIVCPPALIAGWTEELRACGFSVRTLEGGGMWTPARAGEEERVAVYLTTYPKATMYRRFLVVEAFPRVVLDEGHVIRNGKDTARWTAAMSYANRSQCRWILSATPVQNSYSDWKNLTMWLRVRCGGSMLPEIGAEIMLRRTMDELREVIEALLPLDQRPAFPEPPRYIAHDLTVPTGSAEEKLFRALCDQLQNIIDSHAVSALMKLELYLRIQQFLVHPQIYVESMRRKFKGAYPRPDWAGTATKWAACVSEMRVGVEGGKGQIVFCMFRDEMDRVAEEAARMGAEVFCVRGGMGSDAVGEAVKGARAAAAEGKAVVVVVQIVAGGAGLNLQFCTRVLFLSQHWNPAVVHQAVGRAVRIGQRAVVEVHLFRVVDDVMDNLDRRMVQIHLRKISGAREICESLYSGFAPLREESFPGGHSRADAGDPTDSVTGEDDDEGSTYGTEGVVGGGAVDARW
jgi:hypothetical protein